MFFPKFPSTKLQDVNLDWLLKKICKLRGGTRNQVLAKASDADFDFKWITGGGGGGTSDYNDLENQPQINSVTLVGNVSGSDLGLLGATALNNYRTATAQDAIDAGKQAKITASGMLKGDGDGGVTAATAGTDYLAPAALNSYRTAANQDTIDAGKQSKITASGMLKGDGDGGVTAATAGTDYLAPAALMPYRTAAAQNTIDAAQNVNINTRAQADEIGIVINGNSTATGASVGQFIIVRNSIITGITDGLYTAALEIPANTAIDGTYLTGPFADGGLNSVKIEFSSAAIQLESKTIAANSYAEWLSVDVSQPGKKPIAIIGINTNRSSALICGVRLNTTPQTAYAFFKNISNADLVVNSAVINILYINE